jgi:hypothetical protein
LELQIHSKNEAKTQIQYRLEKIVPRNQEERSGEYVRHRCILVGASLIVHGIGDGRTYRFMTVAGGVNSGNELDYGRRVEKNKRH